MDKLLNYVCDELEELEHKADKGKLSMTEMQYVDLLAHTKKNLLTADAMMDNEYSNDDMSYARGRDARRDSMGRYSRYYSRDDARHDMMSQLRDMERSARDDDTRRMVNKWIRQAEEQ